MQSVFIEAKISIILYFGIAGFDQSDIRHTPLKLDHLGRHWIEGIKPIIRFVITLIQTQINPYRTSIARDLCGKI